MKLKWFKKARIASLMSPSETKVGCVLVKNGKMLVLGYNDMNKTHTKCKTHSNYLHAEIHAILRLSRRVARGAHCYVYRGYKNGSPALSRPCPVCEKVLRDAGIKKVFYSTNGGYDGYRF